MCVSSICQSDASPSVSSRLPFTRHWLSPRDQDLFSQLARSEIAETGPAVLAAAAAAVCDSKCQRPKSMCVRYSEWKTGDRSARCDTSRCQRRKIWAPEPRDAAATELKVKTHVQFNYWDGCLVTKTNATNENISVSKREGARRLNGPECIADGTDWASASAPLSPVLNATYTQIFKKLLKEHSGKYKHQQLVVNICSFSRYFLISSRTFPRRHSFSFRRNDGTCFEKHLTQSVKFTFYLSTGQNAELTFTFLQPLDESHLKQIFVNFPSVLLTAGDDFHVSC